MSRISLANEGWNMAPFCIAIVLDFLPCFVSVKWRELLEKYFIAIGWSESLTQHTHNSIKTRKSISYSTLSTRLRVDPLALWTATNQQEYKPSRVRWEWICSTVFVCLHSWESHLLFSQFQQKEAILALERPHVLVCLTGCIRISWVELAKLQSRR